MTVVGRPKESCALRCLDRGPAAHVSSIACAVQNIWSKISRHSGGSKMRGTTGPSVPGSLRSMVSTSANRDASR